MGFGSSPAPPAAQPVTPVPQQDDPKSYESKRVAAATAKAREGDSAHLLAKDDVGRQRRRGAATIF